VILEKTVTGIFRGLFRPTPFSKIQFFKQQNYFHNNNQISFVSSYKINHICIENIFDFDT